MSRDLTVDVAKGIGIVLVVIGHSQLMGRYPDARAYLYSFHMPLFLLLAGLFLSGKGAYFSVLKTRADAILKPYFAVGSVVAIAAAFLAFTRRGEPFIDGAASRLAGLAYGVGSTQVWTPMWFLPFIFVVTVGAWLVLKALCGYKSLVVLVSVVLYFFGLIAVGQPLPWSLDIAPIGVAWALGGWLIYPYIKQVNSRWAALVVALVCVVAHLWLLSFYEPDTNYSRRVFYRPIVGSICALLGIASVVLLSKWIAGRKLIASAFAFFGERTLFILIFHDALQWEFFSRFSKLFGFVFAFLVGVFMSVFVSAVLQYFVSRNFLGVFFLPAYKASKG